MTTQKLCPPLLLTLIRASKYCALPLLVLCHLQPFDCPSHPDDLHPPLLLNMPCYSSDYTNTSPYCCAVLCYPILTHSDRCWCHPCPSSRATPAHSYSAAGRWPDASRVGRSQRICRLEAASCVPAVDRWLLVSSEAPTSCCSHHRGNHAQESGQSVPNAGLPCTPSAAKTIKVTAYKTRRKRQQVQPAVCR